MSDLTAVKALVFDVFGTVVDWRTSLITDFMWWAKGRGIAADWTALVDGWRGMYMASMDDVRKHPERGYVMLDDLHRRSLEKLVAPEQVMMVAAHNGDLAAAQKNGLKTAFVARPTEYGPLQKVDFEATGNWDIVAKDFGGIADKLGC
ncbi:FMN phosphatase YigB (HAD superfamily) [Bradyrhizobium sp. LB1.3]